MKKKNIKRLNLQRLKSVRPELWLILILIFALSLRMYFFVGLVGCEPQDDGVYITNAKLINEGLFDFNSPYMKGDIVNPVYVRAVRYAFNLLVAVSFTIFGVSNYSAALVTILASLGGIIIIFYIGRLLFNEKVGLIAAFLLSFFPLDVTLSTRVLPDIPMVFFMGLSVLFFLKADSIKSVGFFDRKALYFLLSGLSLGFSYLFKELGLVLIGFFILYFLYKRKIDFKFVFLIAGISLIVLAESLFFYVQTDDPLFRYHVTSKSFLFKESIEMDERIYTTSLGLLNIKYPYNYDFLFHLRSLLNLIITDTNFFGLFYFFVFFSVFYMLKVRDKKLLILLFWIIPLYLYLEFGPVNVLYDEGHVNYSMVFKEADSERYLSTITLPALLILAFFLGNIRNRLSLIILLLIFITSLYFINMNTHHLTVYANDLKVAYNYTKDYPETRIYGDYLTVNMLDYYSQYDNEFLRFIDSVDGTDDIRNSFVIIGGSRSCEVVSSYIESLKPSFIKDIPEDWVVRLNITGPIDPFRRENMIIYYAP